jgi:hypothetical protein
VTYAPRYSRLFGGVGIWTKSGRALGLNDRGAEPIAIGSSIPELVAG